MSVSATAFDSLSPEKERELAKEEMEVARKYIGGVPWLMVSWGIGNFLLWLALWPLVIVNVIPLWLGFILASICVTLCYLPSHEAQHSNIAAAGKPYRWLNELVGYVSTVPLVLPYRLAWYLHKLHHTYTNDPERDPDIGIKADGWLGAIWASVKGRQPGRQSQYRAVGQAADTPEMRRTMMEALVMTTTFWIILAALAWSGFAFEALLLWWLPRHIGLTYIQLFLSWAPHFPMDGKGRYRDTRAWRYWAGNLGALGMEYHIIHHLHPAIPLNKTPAAYRDMRHILVARGCRIDGL